MSAGFLVLGRTRASVPPMHQDDLDAAGEAAPAEPPREPPAGSARPARRWAGWLRSNGWLVLAAGAALVLARVVEFSPPAEVRVGDTSVDMVGDAPRQEFASGVGNPQAVQMRATLRLYPRLDLDVREPNPELDGSAQILSQPVVTTIYGMNATVDQTVRLDGGDLELDLVLSGTPRLAGAQGKHGLPMLELEQSLDVTSRRHEWFGEPDQRIHLHARGLLSDLDQHPYRWVFTVEDHLFALDLELHRGG